MSDMLKTQDFVFIRAEDLQDMRAELKALRAEVLRLNAQYYEMETYGCPDCNSDGEIKGNTCFTCNGHGVLYVKPNEAAE